MFYILIIWAFIAYRTFYSPAAKFISVFLTDSYWMGEFCRFSHFPDGNPHLGFHCCCGGSSDLAINAINTHLQIFSPPPPPSMSHLFAYTLWTGFTLFSPLLCKHIEILQHFGSWMRLKNPNYEYIPCHESCTWCVPHPFPVTYFPTFEHSLTIAPPAPNFEFLCLTCINIHFTTACFLQLVFPGELHTFQIVFENGTQGHAFWGE